MAWSARIHPTSFWRGSTPGQPCASHGWCVPWPRQCPLASHKRGTAAIPGKFPQHRPQPQVVRSMCSRGHAPPLKAIPKEPLSKRSVFSSLSVDSSLLISWGLWLKTAVHSFTFNYSPAEGFFKKKIQTSKITAEEKKKPLIIYS